MLVLRAGMERALPEKQKPALGAGFMFRGLGYEYQPPGSNSFTSLISAASFTGLVR